MVSVPPKPALTPPVGVCEVPDEVVPLVEVAEPLVEDVLVLPPEVDEPVFILVEFVFRLLVLVVPEFVFVLLVFVVPVFVFKLFMLVAPEFVFVLVELPV